MDQLVGMVLMAFGVLIKVDVYLLFGCWLLFHGLLDLVCEDKKNRNARHCEERSNPRQAERLYLPRIALSLIEAPRNDVLSGNKKSPDTLYRDYVF
jgi:hypothetical protein